MNANPKFLESTAHVDEAAVQPLPNSRKIYVEGSRPDIRVPMREISQSDTPAMFGVEKNPSLAVYDCSGPYTDPAASIDIRKGLAPLRAPWIAERGDSLDISWLKDESETNADDLPEPSALAQSVMIELEAALEELRGILAELGEEVVE